MQHDPEKSVFINTLCPLEGMGTVMLLILKSQITCFWLLWLLEYAWPEKVNAYLAYSCHISCNCLLPTHALSLSPTKYWSRTHECYQANNMNYIYTITIMVIFLFPGWSQEVRTQPPAPGQHLPSCCQYSWLHDWESGKMSWKYNFFPMHSCTSCNSNILKNFSL